MTSPSSGSTSALVVRDSSSVVEFSAEKVKLIKAMLMPGANDLELAAFIEYAKVVQLDPIARQIHAIPVWNEKAKRYTYQFTVGIDGLRLVAQRTGELDGQEGPFWKAQGGPWVDVWEAEGPPFACKVTVYRKGCEKGFSHVIRYDSFARLKNGKPFGNWLTMPDQMLAVRAEAHALRKAFPREIGPLYERFNEQDEDSFTMVNPDAEATNAQKAELMRLARVLKLSTEQRHAVAGVKSFRELTKAKAAALITELRAEEASAPESGSEPDGDGVDEPGEAGPDLAPMPGAPSPDLQGGVASGQSGPADLGGPSPEFIEGVDAEPAQQELGA